MTPQRISGHEPDANDMTREPGIVGEALNPSQPDAELAEEDEAAKLGDFA